jgi:c-di-GMP-related signal transduction protein
VGVALDTAPHPRARVVAGLLSTLEFALGSPAAVLAQRLTLPPLLKDVLVERDQLLGQLLDVVDAMEDGWWDDMVARSNRLGIRPRVVADAWLEGWRAARDELGLSRADFA